MSAISGMDVNGNIEMASELEFYMKEALLEATKSKDPITKVGSIIVKNDTIIARGHNRMPAECLDDQQNWESKHMKTMFVIHSETSALWNAIQSDMGKHDLLHSTLFVTLSPCHDCAKQISQSGIKRVVYLAFRDKEKYHNAALLMSMKDIELIDLTPENDKDLLCYKQKYDDRYNDHTNVLSH